MEEEKLYQEIRNNFVAKYRAHFLPKIVIHHEAIYSKGKELTKKDKIITIIIWLLILAFIINLAIGALMMNIKAPFIIILLSFLFGFIIIISIYKLIDYFKLDQNIGM